MGFEPSRGPRLLYAVSAHGFGHLTRSMLVLRELARLVPELRPTVATALEESVVSRELEIPYRHVPARPDPGRAPARFLQSDAGAPLGARRAGPTLEERGCRGEKRPVRSRRLSSTLQAGIHVLVCPVQPLWEQRRRLT